MHYTDETCSEFAPFCRRAMSIVHDMFSALAEHVWSVLPTRINQRQRAYFMTVRSERRLQASVFKEWVQVQMDNQGRGEVAAKNQNRYRRMRDKIELEVSLSNK
jgi:DNA-binding transcriptional regulator/RsmH inhibitor MraZ